MYVLLTSLHLLRCLTCQLDDTLPTLADQNITQLYTIPGSQPGEETHDSRADELRKLAKSLLANFLELVGILSINPDEVRLAARTLKVFSY